MKELCSLLFRQGGVFYDLQSEALVMSVEKIGIACHKLQYSGGMERYVIDLVNGFAALDIAVTCFAKKFNTNLPEYSKITPVTINTSWVPGKLRDQLFSYLLGRKLQKINSGPLISVARNMHSEVAICGGTHLGFLQHTKKKVSFSDRLQIDLEHQFYQNAKLIIAHSKLMAEEIEHCYDIPSQKIRVVYPPVDVARFYPAPSKDEVKKALNLPLDKKVFLFPSSGHTRKGYNLLEAYFSSSDLPIHLAVVGRPLLRSAKNVAYYGYYQDIRAFYQAADFTILASTYEPFGLVAVESILSGTPIIVSDKLGAGEVVNDAAKYVFESGNLADLDRVIQQALAAEFCLPKNVHSLLNYDFSVKTHCQEILDFLLEFGLPII